LPGAASRRLPARDRFGLDAAFGRVRPCAFLARGPRAERERAAPGKAGRGDKLATQLNG